MRKKIEREFYGVNDIFDLYLSILKYQDKLRYININRARKIKLNNENEQLVHHIPCPQIREIDGLIARNYSPIRPENDRKYKKKLASKRQRVITRANIHVL